MVRQKRMIRSLSGYNPGGGACHGLHVQVCPHEMTSRYSAGALSVRSVALSGSGSAAVMGRRAAAHPSNVLVPRPSSSRTTSDAGVAWPRIADACSAVASEPEAAGYMRILVDCACACMQGRAARQHEISHLTLCSAIALHAQPRCATYLCSCLRLLHPNSVQRRCPRLHALATKSTCFAEHRLDMRCSFGQFLSVRTLGPI